MQAAPRGDRGAATSLVGPLGEGRAAHSIRACHYSHVCVQVHHKSRACVLIALECLHVRACCWVGAPASWKAGRPAAQTREQWTISSQRKKKRCLRIVARRCHGRQAQQVHAAFGKLGLALKPKHTHKHTNTMGKKTNTQKTECMLLASFDCYLVINGVSDVKHANQTWMALSLHRQENAQTHQQHLIATWHVCVALSTNSALQPQQHASSCSM